MLHFSVAINNYNYKRFVAEAIESAFAQTHPPLEVIVVDDGSTDGSADHIQALYGDRVRLIRSDNQGQLSALRLGVRHARGDFVAFLDADDRFMPHHLAAAAARIAAEPSADFIIASQVYVENDRRFDAKGQTGDIDFGYTTLSGLTRDWIGAATSCLIVRRSSLNFLEALPPEAMQDWRLRADDVVIFGAGVGGARKLKIGRPSVEYRVHGQNGFHGRPRSAEQRETHRQQVCRLLAQLNELNFPGLDAASIIRRELTRNQLRKLRNKRELIKAMRQGAGRLSGKIGVTLAILAKT
jgi:glycosyltransferase involved in cell wall biosynthesis